MWAQAAGGGAGAAGSEGAAAAGGAAAGGGNLDFLRNNSQFQALRQIVQANPQILQPMLQVNNMLYCLVGCAQYVEPVALFESHLDTVTKLLQR